MRNQRKRRVMGRDLRKTLRAAPGGAATISLCMIVRDEEANLAACLDSVQHAMDEIIIVDTGSTDRTKEIARRYTDKVFDFEWVDDFAAARNYSFSLATKDYILWMDADDRLEGENGARLIRLKTELQGVDIVLMKYESGFDEQGRAAFSYYRERLVRREAGLAWQDPVHEFIPMDGTVRTIDIAIAHRQAHNAHRAGQNLRIYKRMLAEGKALAPRQKFYMAREYMEAGDDLAAMRWFEEYLDEKGGWAEDRIAAHCDLARLQAKSAALEDMALQELVLSFAEDLPRAEACCAIGYIYKNREDFRRAAFWFEMARKLPYRPVMGFTNEDDWGFVPTLECAVCYYRIGDAAMAEKYNEQAGQLKPGAQEVENNRRFFASLEAKAQGGEAE